MVVRCGPILRLVGLRRGGRVGGVALQQHRVGQGSGSRRVVDATCFCWPSSIETNGPDGTYRLPVGHMFPPLARPRSGTTRDGVGGQIVGLNAFLDTERWFPMFDLPEHLDDSPT